MSWYSGVTGGTAVGVMITLFDTELVKNANWSIYDAAAGTNRKVYRCNDGAYSDFYFDVNDNIGTSYCTVGLWEGWNSGTHAGTGLSLANRYIAKWNGSYGMALNGTRMVFCDLLNGRGYYVGQSIRAIETLNYPIITALTSNTATNNALAAYGGATGLSVDMLKIGGGVTRPVFPFGINAVNAYCKPSKHPLGAAFFGNHPLIVGTDNRFLGWYDGVTAFASGSEWANGDLLVVNGVNYVVIICSAAGLKQAIVRMA